MRFLIVLTALFAAGCAQQAVSSGPSPASELRSEVQAYDYRGRNDPEGELQVRIDDGSGERLLPVANLGRGDEARSLPTRSAGTLRVAASLVRDGRTIATQSVELPLRPDWRYGIALHVTAANPLEGCFGCLGVRSTPIAGETGPNAPKLHVVWGGNSISSPAVY